MQTSRPFLTALLIVLLSAACALAHQETPAPSGTGDHHATAQPSASGAANTENHNSLVSHLGNPEYLHTLINPMPVYGLSMGMMALIIALIMRSRRVAIAALILVLLAGLSAWPTYYFGEAAYDRIKAMSDPAGEQWLDEHMARGEKLVYVFYLLAALAAAGIVLPRRWPNSAIPLAITTLILGGATLAIGGYISYAGGHVRHQEFRFEPPPTPQMAEHQQGQDQHATDMQKDETAKSPAPTTQQPMEHARPEQMQSPGQQPMEHGAMPSPGEKPMSEEEKKQLEASRLQLEASQKQLEASRKQLEAVSGASPSSSPAPSGSPGPSPSPEHKQDDHPH